MLRASTPGGHFLIRSAWLASVALLAIAVAFALARDTRPASIVAIAAVALFVGAYVAYLVRHLLFVRDVARAERALDSGEAEVARAILAPLLALYPGLALVQRAAGRTLYALGDPLSAASLLERASRSYEGDVPLAVALVASYAALNRGGDARRASALAPKEADVRLALAWAELVALGGDRAAGAAVAAELRERADVRSDASRSAMAAALAAISAAGRGDRRTADLALAEARGAALEPYERAFVTYLEGVALREAGDTPAALAAFDRAMEAAPGTIGEALARRERANLLSRAAIRAEAQPSSGGPPAD